MRSLLATLVLPGQQPGPRRRCRIAAVPDSATVGGAAIERGNRPTAAPPFACLLIIGFRYEDAAKPPNGRAARSAV